MREFGQRLVAFEVAMSGGAARVNDALGNALMVEVRDFFPKDEVLQQRLAAQSCLERILIVADGTPWLVVRGRPAARIDPNAVQRAGTRVETQLQDSPNPTLGEALISLRVLAPHHRVGGSTACPAAGRAPHRQTRIGFAALKGNAAASSSAPAIFAVNASSADERRPFALGPLTVERAELRAPAWSSSGRALLAGSLREGTGFSGLAGLAEAPALTGIAFCGATAAAGLGRRRGASGFRDRPPGFFFAAMNSLRSIYESGKCMWRRDCAVSVDMPAVAATVLRRATHAWNDR